MLLSGNSSEGKGNHRDCQLDSVNIRFASDTNLRWIFFQQRLKLFCALSAWIKTREQVHVAFQGGPFVVGWFLGAGDHELFSNQERGTRFALRTCENSPPETSMSSYATLSKQLDRVQLYKYTKNEARERISITWILATC